MYTQYTIRQSGKGKCLLYLFPQMIHNSTISYRQGKMFILSVSANDHMIKRTPKKKKKKKKKHGKKAWQIFTYQWQLH